MSDDSSLSIVVVNGREPPQRLLCTVADQADPQDELLLVWDSHSAFADGWFGQRTSRTHAPPSAAGRWRVIHSGPGAASARNSGWRASSGRWVLFLDDDVRVDGLFLVAVRGALSRCSREAGIVTFRVLDQSMVVRGTNVVTLDRGPADRMSRGPVALEDVWQYGVGAAMLVKRDLLDVTGGFKNHLGAGRNNGGSEDIEFLWHASRHTTVRYCADVVVLHPQLEGARETGQKMAAYGRAIGRLSGLCAGAQGVNMLLGFCTYVLRSMRPGSLVHLGFRDRMALRRAAVRAAVLAAGVHLRARGTRTPGDLLCPRCSSR